ncbi:MAG: transposase [Pseudomonadota bacterium]
MARLPRLDVPGIPQHVVQRGVDRGICFGDDLDRETYLASLSDATQATGVAIHAYVLMTNHVHLLATSPAKGALSDMMQRLGRRYVRRFNSRYVRTGTLWEGRFRSSLVDSQTYLLQCYRYIDLNPVRASMVATPAEYAWSSALHNITGAIDPLITPHDQYQALGANREDRARRYRALIDDLLTPTQMEAIRAHLQQGKELGSPGFQQQIGELLDREVDLKAMGRPNRFERSS